MPIQTATTESAANFKPALRINEAITASMERRALQWMAKRAPRWLTSDQLTALGLFAQVGAGASYALARWHRYGLALAIVFLALNWLGDSLDGTLARVRCQQRPRYGFYVDHMVDVFGAVALMGGLGLSGLVHWPLAIALLVAFLLLACESYLATYTLSHFQLSQGMFGPTEIRILLALGNLAAMRSPLATIFGHKLLLFDMGGAAGVCFMLVTVVVVTARHTVKLFREEPLA